MPQTREGPLRHFFDDVFFEWVNDQIMMIKDYPYSETNLIGDLEFRFRPGTQWGPIGKMRNQFHKCFFVI